MKCAELLIRSLHDLVFLLSHQYVLCSDLPIIGSSYPFCRLASLCFFFLEDHTVFFGLTLKETGLLNQLRVNICKGNNINYLNFMD